MPETLLLFGTKTAGPTNRGSEILPHMEHFVQLTRKLQRPPLIRALIEGVLAASLPALGEVTEGAKGVLPIASRKAVFTAVADLGHAEQSRIEQAAERVILLGDCRRAKGHLCFATPCGVLVGTAGMRHRPE